MIDPLIEQRTKLLEQVAEIDKMLERPPALDDYTGLHWLMLVSDFYKSVAESELIWEPYKGTELGAYLGEEGCAESRCFMFHHWQRGHCQQCPLNINGKDGGCMSSGNPCYVQEAVRKMRELTGNGQVSNFCNKVHSDFAKWAMCRIYDYATDLGYTMAQTIYGLLFKRDDKYFKAVYKGYEEVKRD